MPSQSFLMLLLEHCDVLSRTPTAKKPNLLDSRAVPRGLQLEGVEKGNHRLDSQDDRSLVALSNMEPSLSPLPNGTGRLMFLQRQ